jgi:hypothetical protein
MPEISSSRAAALSTGATWPLTVLLYLMFAVICSWLVMMRAGRM